MTSKENEFILEVLDRDKDARNYYSNEDSSAPEDIERKQIFHYSCGKKHKIKLEDNDSFPLKISVNKELVELYDSTLSTFSCTCDDFYSQELNYCEHIAVIERLFRYHSRNDFVKYLVSHFALNKPKQSKNTFVFFNTLKQQYTVVGKGHKEEVLLLFKDFDNKEHKQLLVENQDFLNVYIASAALKKLVSEIDPNKMDSINKFLYNKKSLLDQDIGNKGTEGLLKNNINLFEYQKDVFVNCLASKRCVVAMQMGSGKTITSIAVYEYLSKQNPNMSMLVICPNTLKTQWVQEIKRTTGKEAIILNSKDQIKSWDNTGIAVINYQMMTRYIEDFMDDGKKTKYVADMLIVDEMQYVKNDTSKAWRAMRRLKSEYFLALSGTIIENRLDDLYNVMQIVDENALGPKWKFDRDFQKTLAASKYKITYGGIKNVDKLHEKIKHCVFTISQEELNKKLPSISFKTNYIQLSDEQINEETRYREMADALLRKGMEKHLRPHEKILLNAYLLKARQACTAMELLDKNKRDYYEPKVFEVKKIIEQHCITNREKIILFSEWTEMLGIVERMILKEFPTIKHVTYSGDVQTKLRPKLVSDFKTDPDTMIFLSSDAGGTGLDGLQLVSNIVVHTEIPWNPAKIDQRNARLHRTLQKNPVTCYYIVADSGTEFKMQEKIMQKREIRKAALAFDRSDEEMILKASELKEILG